MSTDKKCGSLGCGDHGACQPSGACRCVDFWSGPLCENGPPAGTPCTKSDAAFRAAHRNGDKACGNHGSYGVCQDSGICNCGLLASPAHGSYCEYACEPHDPYACGGEKFGTCNPYYKTCECKNGWSGPGCEVAPPKSSTPAPAKCTELGDCDWGGHLTREPSKLAEVGCSTSGATAGTCICPPEYTGVACEKLMLPNGEACGSAADCLVQRCVSSQCSNSGSSCDVDTDCEPVTCFAGVCTSPVSESTGGNKPFFKVLKTMVNSFVEGLLSPAGIEYLVAMDLVTSLTRGEGYIADIFSRLMGEGVIAKMKAGAVDAITAGIEGMAAAAARVGEGMATKLVTQQLTAKAVDVASSTAIRESVEKAVEFLAGVMGKMWSLLNWMQGIGLILDMTDAAGLNQMMSQSILSMTRKHFYAAYNTNADLFKNNIYFPYEYLPEQTIDFWKYLYSTSGGKHELAYATEYLSRLQVNSDGADIIPLFVPSSTTATRQSLDAEHHKNSYNKFIWSLSAGNDDVYVKMKKYWWGGLAGVVVIVAVVVTGLCVGLKSSKKRRHRAGVAPSPPPSVSGVSRGAPPPLVSGVSRGAPAPSVSGGSRGAPAPLVSGVSRGPPPPLVSGGSRGAPPACSRTFLRRQPVTTNDVFK